MRYEAWAELVYNSGYRKIIVDYFNDYDSAEIWIKTKENEIKFSGGYIDDYDINYS